MRGLEDFNDQEYQDDSCDSDELVCDECGISVDDENDLFYHDGMNVCESCLDDIRRSEELSFREREQEDFNDYD